MHFPSSILFLAFSFLNLLNQQTQAYRIRGIRPPVMRILPQHNQQIESNIESNVKRIDSKADKKKSKHPLPPYFGDADAHANQSQRKRRHSRLVQRLKEIGVDTAAVLNNFRVDRTINHMISDSAAKELNTLSTDVKEEINSFKGELVNAMAAAEHDRTTAERRIQRRIRSAWRNRDYVIGSYQYRHTENGDIRTGYNVMSNSKVKKVNKKRTRGGRVFLMWG